MAVVIYWVIPFPFTPTNHDERSSLLQRASKQAFVTVQETSDDVSSKFSVYSLLFPPVSLENILQITVEEMLYMCGWYW